MYYIRIWIIIQQLVFLVVTIKKLLDKEYPLPPIYNLINILYLVILLLMICKSYFSSGIQIIKVCLVLVQLNNYLSLFKRKTIFEDEDPNRIWGFILRIIMIVWNQSIVANLFDKYANKLNFCNSLIILVGMFKQIYGFKDIDKHCI